MGGYRLHAVIPCRDHEEMFEDEALVIYRQLLAAAEAVTDPKFDRASLDDRVSILSMAACSPVALESGRQPSPNITLSTADASRSAPFPQGSSSAARAP